MATITVNTLEDENNGTGDLSLREAIATATSGDPIGLDLSDPDSFDFV